MTTVGPVRPRLACPAWCTLAGAGHLDDYEAATPTGLLIRTHEHGIGTAGPASVCLVADEIAGGDGAGPVMAPPVLQLLVEDGAHLGADDARRLAALLLQAVEVLGTVEGLQP